MNQITSYLFLCITIICNVCAQFFSKKASGSLQTWQDIANPYIFIAILFYAMSTASYIMVLRKIPLSTAYPLFSITYVLIFIIGHYFFGEVIDTYKIIGMLLIITGILFFAVSASRVG